MSKKILICDDEESVRESIKLILKYETNFIIFEASTGKEVQTILKGNPDIFLAFLDLKMPGMDGIKLLGMIRKDYLKIKIIMISGYMDDDTKNQSYSLGISNYITKPFSIKNFITILKDTIKDA